jgi:hypothetical protein
VHQIAAQENREAWQNRHSTNSAGLFSQFTATQTIDVTNEVQVQEDEISVLDDTLPSPQHHSTPLVCKNKRKIDELENPRPSTSKR